MKILQINAISGTRSTGRICVEIAEYLNKSGNEGYIAYSDGVPYENGYKIGTPLEIKLHALFSRILGLQAYFSRNGTRKLIKFIKELKPDVVHLHNLHGNYINLKILLAFFTENDIPTVLTLHDCWFYTGKCSHYTVDNCYKWQSLCFNCPRKLKDNPSWFLDRTKKMFLDKKEWFSKIPRLAVVGVSDWLINEVRKSFLSSAKIVTRVYNWIDFELFRHTNTDELCNNLGIEDKFIILGIASEWSNAKGLDKYVELASLIPIDMSIILVGNIKEKICLPNNIKHIKETHNVNELVKFYSIADVLLNLSHEETFGLVSAEALSCGTPVIVYNSTACSEVIGDSDCGVILETNCIEELLRAILKIKNYGKTYYAPNCRNRVIEMYDKEKLLLEYCKIYHSIYNEELT